MLPANAMYVHVPFCKTICHYCDFYKLCYRPEFVALYFEGVRKEIAALHPFPCKTIYIGGGTPSALSKEELTTLFTLITPFREEECEMTFEINPDDCNEELVVFLMEHGVNRFSVGVQTFSDSLLQVLNRRHDSKKAISTLELLMKYNLNCSADLIYGIPNQSLDQVMEDLNRLIALKIPHISAYSLQIEPHTYFSIHHVESLEDDILRDYYDAIVLRLQEAGYHRYEVSNFSLPGAESRHNLVYWHADSYYGLGPGASGYLHDVRYTNTKQLPLYAKGNQVAEQIKLTKEDQEFEFLMLGLRLEEGISLSEYQQRFHRDLLTTYRSSIHTLTEQGLIYVEQGRLRVTPDGFYILDTILLQLTQPQNEK